MLSNSKYKFIVFETEPRLGDLTSPAGLPEPPLHMVQASRVSRIEFFAYTALLYPTRLATSVPQHLLTLGSSLVTRTPNLTVPVANVSPFLTHYPKAINCAPGLRRSLGTGVLTATSKNPGD